MKAKHLAFCLFGWLACGSALHAQTTAFQYQGTLAVNGANANGTFEFQFKLWDSLSAGTQVTPVVLKTAGGIRVASGNFVVVLDFGAGALTGAARWLEIATRTNGSLAAFTVVSPRQNVPFVPHAVFATTAGAVANGVIGNAALGANAVTGPKLAAGAVVKSLNNLRDNVVLQAGSNVVLTTVGNTITLTAAVPTGTGGTTIGAAMLNGTNLFTGTNIFNAPVLATNGNNQFTGRFSGNGASLSGLPPTALVGTLAPAQIPALDAAKIASGILATAQIPNLDAAKIVSGTLGSAQIPNLGAAKITSGTFAPAQIPALDAAKITGGIFPDARLSANVALLNGTNTHTGTNIFNAPVLATNPNNQFTGKFTGDGTLLANVPGSFLWNTVSSPALNAQPNAGYLITGVAQANVTLPTAPSVGDIVRVTATSASAWQWIPNAGQQIVSFLGSTGAVWSPGASVANRGWQSIATSGDGLKLVAADYLGPASTGGQIYTSADGGASWVQRASNHFWFAVASAANGTKLVAVDSVGTNFNGGQIHTSTDSGVTWTPRESNRFWGGIASSADGTKLVAIDYYGPAFNGGFIYTSADSGATWTARANDTNRYWNAIASSADGTRLVAAVDGGQLHTSADAGLTWVAHSIATAWQAVASSADGTHLVAVVRGGQIYTSVNAGASWTARDTNRYWYAVASSADGTKLFAADYFGSGFAGGQIYTSGDAGVTWVPRATNRRWTAIASSADGTRVVAVEKAVSNFGLPGSGQIWLSIDSGVTWMPSVGAVMFLSGVSPGPYAGAAGASSGLQYLGNGIWQAITESQIAASSVGAAQLADNSVTAAKINGALTPGQIPNLDAGKITSGVLATAQIPNLDAAKIVSGTLATAQIPALDAAKITSGILTTAQIPNLDAGKITSGVLATAQIPNLDAPKITSGIFPDARLSVNVALLNGTNTFTGTNQFGAPVLATNRNNQFGGAFTGTFSGPGTLRWQSVAGIAQAAAANVGYVLANDGLVTVTLPAAPNIGDVVRVLGLGSGGWVIAQNDGQQIRVEATTSTAGVGGGASGGQWTALELVHVSGGVFVAASHQGTITLQ